MYKFDSNIDLEHLVGLNVTQACVDQWNVLINFYPEHHIDMSGGWRLIDDSGNEIDKNEEHSVRNSFQVHRLVGSSISAYRVVSPELLEVTFSNGFKLEIIDNSEQYETISISTNIYV
jgi:hypothetical protein